MKFKMFLMSVLMIMVMAIMPVTTAYASSGSAEQESAWAKLEEKYDTMNKYGNTYGNIGFNGFPIYLWSELGLSDNSTIQSLDEKKSICDRLAKDGYVCVYGKNRTVTEEEYIMFWDIYCQCRDNKISNTNYIDSNISTTNSCEMWLDKETFNIMMSNYTALEEEAQIIASGTIPTKLKRDDLARLISRVIVFDELVLSGSSEGSDSSNANSSNENASYTDTTMKDVFEESEKVGNETYPIIIAIVVVFLVVIVVVVVLFMGKKTRK